MTAYHVLRLDLAAADSNTGEDILALVGLGVKAHSAEAAVRTFLEAKPANGIYVAVPARSWKPTAVTVETQTRLRIGGAE